MDLREFRELKKEYALEWYEWLFIAFLEDGVELAIAEGPEAALNQSLNRALMEEDVTKVLGLLPERTVVILDQILVDDEKDVKLGDELGISGSRVQQLYRKGLAKIHLDKRCQAILTGEWRQRPDAATLVSANYEPEDNEDISYLELPVGTNNCLRRAKIQTYREFRAWYEKKKCHGVDDLGYELKKIFNLGDVRAKDIIAAMEKCGWLNFLK